MLGPHFNHSDLLLCSRRWSQQDARTGPPDVLKLRHLGSSLFRKLHLCMSAACFVCRTCDYLAGVKRSVCWLLAQLINSSRFTNGSAQRLDLQSFNTDPYQIPDTLRSLCVAPDGCSKQMFSHTQTSDSGCFRTCLFITPSVCLLVCFPISYMVFLWARIKLTHCQFPQGGDDLILVSPCY